MDDTRCLEVRLPADLPNSTYAALAQGVWALLNLVGLGEESSLRPDAMITDEELNEAFDADVQGYPWSQS